jgi:N-succinyl-L-ornithine transcarbamylase
MKQFLSVYDVQNINELVNEGFKQKANPFADELLGKHKTMGLIFFNSSLRTRLSTQKAAQNLGMNTIVMNVGQDSWQLEFEDGVIMDSTKAEHIKEAAPVIGSYCDIIGVRAFADMKSQLTDYQEVVMNSFAKYARVPIVNLESATRHPCQSLADLITIEEFKTKPKPKVVLTWVPHFKPLPQAVANSFCEWLNRTEYEFVVTHPEGYELSPDYVGNAKAIQNQNEAFEDADFIYAKNWSSFYQYGQVLTQDSSWKITAEKMALTNNGKFMHCLPVRRNLKVTDEVIDSPNSIVVQQAANREWAAQAVLKKILEGMK